MRPLFPALLGLLTACGGNFSNEDLEYLNALPTREELASKLPDSAAFSGRRGERLSVGEPSPLYQDTRQASDNFNTLLDELLTLVETIRALPPTTREPHRRTWGPFTDTNQPGHEARFVMERQEDANVFTYQFQFKPIQADDSEWWSFLAGAFRADAGVRKGEGELHLFVGEAVAKGLHVEGLHPLQQLDVVYQTRELPTRVEMRLIAQSPSAPAEVRYTYRELPGGWGGDAVHPAGHGGGARWAERGCGNHQPVDASPGGGWERSSSFEEISRAPDTASAGTPSTKSPTPSEAGSCSARET
ncbi:hypothetical protein [Stigmatella aurantiaca]|uniref:Lipoprotein n=1 Tax=Stigmatella aurantiaca (strain DW4/3-1) TaxID=378806 RepID=Q08XS9_STIAD|nr:hypothetical protein [Stigmatella aurantiaca]EAU65289.1 hypothetical protein STIAU_5337 [Stigmatella aurantiaca DW4/3-1]